MSEIQRLVEESQLLVQLVDKAADTQKHGSYAQRHPAEGKMKTCPYCRIRERNHECRAKLTHAVDSGRSLVKGRRLKPRGEK